MRRIILTLCLLLPLAASAADKDDFATTGSSYRLAKLTPKNWKEVKQFVESALPGKYQKCGDYIVVYTPLNEPRDHKSGRKRVGFAIAATDGSVYAPVMVYGDHRYHLVLAGNETIPFEKPYHSKTFDANGYLLYLPPKEFFTVRGCLHAKIEAPPLPKKPSI